MSDRAVDRVFPASTSKAVRACSRPRVALTTNAEETIKTDNPRSRRGRGGNVREDRRRPASSTSSFKSTSRRGSSRLSCEGRAFTEAPDITTHICGICPVAYQMSAVQAMEQICGVEGGWTSYVLCVVCSIAANGSRATRCMCSCSMHPTSSATTVSSSSLVTNDWSAHGA